MSGLKLGGVLSLEEKEQFHREGYYIARGLLADDADAIRDHFMKLHAGGPIPNCFEPLTAEEADGDILKMYPRMMHPHKVDALSMDYMLYPKIMHILADLLDEEPIAAQSMFYFKPPGARGQALHQDNFYLRVEPGTCIAAWMAVDAADEENGGLFIVPKSNEFDVLCPHEADPQYSFTKEEVDIPEGYRAVPIHMQAGDMLFFNGSVIHGSYPNRSKDRFRRALICHYTGISNKSISHWYKPIYRYNGEIVEMGVTETGSPCGNEYAASAAH